MIYLSAPLPSPKSTRSRVQHSERDLRQSPFEITGSSNAAAVERSQEYDTSSPSRLLLQWLRDSGTSGSEALAHGRCVAHSTNVRPERVPCLLAI